MSTPLAPLPIRLYCDLAAPANLLDINRSQPPSFYRGDDIEIDIGIGENGNLLTSVATSGAGGISSVTAQIFASENDTRSPMMSCTTSTINTALTQTEWTSDTTPFYHAAFVFPNSQTAITLNGAASVNYWLRITALTTDSTAKIITLLDGPITVRDGPVSTAVAPPLSAPAGGTSFPLLIDATSGLYHKLTILNEGGVLTLQISDTGYNLGTTSLPVPMLLDATTDLYHQITILNTGGVLTLQISDTGY
jgi:hypothetical protein